jgi:hypothetical protein
MKDRRGFSDADAANASTMDAFMRAGGNNFQKWQRNGSDWSNSRTTSVTMDANYMMTAVYLTPNGP